MRGPDAAAKEAAMNGGIQALLGWVLVLGIGSALATEAGEAAGARIIQTDERHPIGSYLTDEQGRSVYMFEADSSNQTTCYDACAQAWPPVLTDGRPTAGPGVDESLLGTIERADGSLQVTYNGWPLYYFIKDSESGDINGQGVNGFGADWYLLTPGGQVARAEGTEERPRG